MEVPSEARGGVFGAKREEKRRLDKIILYGKIKIDRAREGARFLILAFLTGFWYA